MGMGAPPATPNPVPVRQRSGTGQIYYSSGRGGQTRVPVGEPSTPRGAMLERCPGPAGAA